MRFPWLRASLVLFGLGATVGTALDAIHTHSGTTAYPDPIVFMMAWWTPPIFGFAGLSTGLAYPLVRALRRRDVATTRSPARAASGFALFVGLYLASGYLPASNAVKLVVLLAGACALGWANARTRGAILVAVTAAIAGPVIEIVLVSLGAFRHLQPDVLGIPIWLPALYASGSIAFGVAGVVIGDALRARAGVDLTPSSSAGSLP
jgi:hypothetical protein